MTECPGQNDELDQGRWRQHPNAQYPDGPRIGSLRAHFLLSRESMKVRTILFRSYLIATGLFYLGSTHFSEPACYAQEASSKEAPTDATNPSGAASSATPAVGKTIVGTASWYGPGLQGHRTATGERFDSHKATAAGKQLPLGSEAVITNLENGRSVKVRVNDCGPNPKGRKIDLSKRAAQKLHMTHDGTASVKIKVVEASPDATDCEGKKVNSH
jgi:rare lipoprotein A (peptidoglycan hydrolase)